MITSGLEKAGGNLYRIKTHHLHTPYNIGNLGSTYGPLHQVVGRKRVVRLLRVCHNQQRSILKQALGQLAEAVRL